MPGRGEPYAHRVDERVAYGVHRAVRIHGRRRHREGGHRLVPGDLARPGAQDQRMPRRNAPYPVVGRRVVQRGRDVRGGEQRGQVTEVEVGLDEVGERERGRGVRRTAGPRGVEHRLGAREITADHGAAADLDDRRVTAGPGRQMPKCPSARGEQAQAQLLVGGTARAEDRDARLGVDLHDPHLVGPPVADRPQRIRVPHRSWDPTGWTVSPSRPVAPAEPITAAPAAVLLHPTNHRIDASTGCGQPVHRTNWAPCCHEGRLPEGWRSRLRSREDALDEGQPDKDDPTSATRMRPRYAPPKHLTRPQLPW